MKPGDLLRNAQTGEERFRIESLIEEGRSFWVALGADTHLDDMKVVLKAIKYSDEPNRSEAQQRREAMRMEVEALTVPCVLLPEPIDFFDVESDLDVGTEHEPVVVLEYQSGRTLREEVGRSEGGLEPTRALKLIHEIALGLHTLHEAGYVYRDLNPDHIIIGLDDIIHFVGTGNIWKTRQRPVIAKFGVSERWSAPEMRNEVSGKYILPVADIYSLGALFAFLLTGYEPTMAVESPLVPQAYEKLSKLPEGYQLIIAKCLQAMAKFRVKRLGQLLPFLTPQTLPTREVKMFSNVGLPEPFDPATPYDRVPQGNRAMDSKLSSGPLISVPRSEPDGASAQAANPSAPPEQPQTTAIAKREETAPVVWYQKAYQGCLSAIGAGAILLSLGGAAVWALVSAW